MFRNSYYAKIISLVKEKPMSQREIHEKIGKDKITIQGVAKNLNLGVNNGAIIYLGNKVNKKDAKWIIKEYFGVKWPTDAWQCYLYVPNTKKFYQRLKHKLKNKPIAREIILFYSIIELSAMLQSILFENLKVLRIDFKSRGQNLSDEELKKKVINKRKEVKAFYRNRDRKDPILKFLQLTPLMYWVGFKRATPIEAKEYDPSKDAVLIKDRLVEKLRLITKTT